mmetsp:Transcript_992/g.1256  ORF Transcript_992/g.1256 Transcript_992/m.1256 type:complete len:120 (-) Transcript_992:825-1184(-)
MLVTIRRMAHQSQVVFADLVLNFSKGNVIRAKAASMHMSEYLKVTALNTSRENVTAEGHVNGSMNLSRKQAFQTIHHHSPTIPKSESLRLLHQRNGNGNGILKLPSDLTLFSCIILLFY